MKKCDTFYFYFNFPPWFAKERNFKKKNNFISP